MDPVNKWLWTIVAFMTALIIVISIKAGSGTYEMVVMPSKVLSNHDVVYVLNTKSGEIRARAWGHDGLRFISGSSAGKISKRWVTISSRDTYNRSGFNQRLNQ